MESDRPACAARLERAGRAFSAVAASGVELIVVVMGCIRFRPIRWNHRTSRTGSTWRKTHLNALYPCV